MALLPAIVKQPSEAIFVTFDFAKAIAGASSIATVTNVVAMKCDVVAGSQNVTLSNTGISGKAMQVRVAGGTHGESYRITAVVVDAGGQTHELDGLIEVIES